MEHTLWNTAVVTSLAKFKYQIAKVPLFLLRNTNINKTTQKGECPILKTIWLSYPLIVKEVETE